MNKFSDYLIGNEITDIGPNDLILFSKDMGDGSFATKVGRVSNYTKKRIIADTTFSIGLSGNFLTLQDFSLFLQNCIVEEGSNITVELLEDITISSADFSTILQPLMIRGGGSINFSGKRNGSAATTSNIAYTLISAAAGTTSFDRKNILSVPDASLFELNRYIFVTSASGGTNPSELVSAHKIINVDTALNRITVNNTNSLASSGAVTGNLTLPVNWTKINFSDDANPSGGGGVSASINLIDNISIKFSNIIFDYVASDFLSSNSITFNTSGNLGFNNCIMSPGIKINVNGTLASNIKTRFFTSLVGLRMMRNAEASSMLSVTTAEVQIGGSLFSGGNSGTAAISASRGANIISSASSTISSVSLGTSATQGSQIIANLSRLNNTTASSPAVNTVGNQNSYVWQ